MKRGLTEEEWENEVVEVLVLVDYRILENLFDVIYAA